MYMTMRMNLALSGDTFISFDHADRAYRTVLECLADGITDWEAGAKIIFLSDHSVRPGDIGPDVEPEAVMEIIRVKHLAKARTLVLLIGRDTRGRKFVDWEIAAALARKCALHAILLPTVPRTLADQYLPPRFRDNLETEYASLCFWEDIFDNPDELCSVLFGGNGHYEETEGLIRNERPLFKRNRPRQRDSTYQEPAPPPRVGAPLMKGIAERILRLREQAGLAPAEAAGHMGLPEKDYLLLEQDDEQVNQSSLRELAHLADLIGLSLLELLDPAPSEWPERTFTLPDLRKRIIAHDRIHRLLREKWNWNLVPLDENDWAERMWEYPLAFIRDASYALVEDWRCFVPRQCQSRNTPRHGNISSVKKPEG